MAEEFKKTGLMDGMGESDNAPEDDGGSAKYSLPFGLCKKYGIPIGKNWTPRDAWAALKGKGVVSDVSGEYDELDKTGEQGNETQDGTNPQEEVKTNGDVVKFSTREEAVRYIQDKVGMNISQGMSKIPDDVFIPNAERLANLEKKFGIIGKQPNRVDFGTDVHRISTYAAIATNAGEGVVAELNINPLFFKNAQTLIAAEERALKSGYSMPHDDSQNLVYTVTHEYGHMVFTPLLYDNDLKAEIQDIYKQGIINYSTGDEILKKVKKAKEKAAKKIENDIIKIAKEKDKTINVKSLMSRYGNEKHVEWLAEAFANSQCGKPNAIGDATMEYLKRRGMI